jgi:hypothetical protein
MPNSIVKVAAPLTFQEYVKRLSPAVVFEHLIQKSTEKRKILSSSMIEEVSGKFLQPAALRKRLAGCSQEAQEFIAVAYLSGAGGYSRATSSTLRRELMESFLLFTVRDKAGITAFVGFEDCVEALAEPCSRVLSESLKRRHTGKSATAWQWRCCNDLAILLSMALRGELVKTLKGNLLRTSSLTLKRLLMGTRTNCVAETEERDSDHVIAFLLAYALRSGILFEDEKSFSSTHEEVSRWLEQPLEQRRQDLVAFCFDYCGAWRKGMFNALASLSGAEWLSAAFGSEGGFTAGTLIHLLHYLCVLDFAKINQESLWRLRSSQEKEPLSAVQGAAPGSVIVSADFSVVLSQEISPVTLYAFSLLGTFSIFDCVYKATIDRETVNNALAAGIPADRLLGFLLQWHAPDNVVATVAEWIREFSRVYVNNRVIVASFDERTTLQLQSYKPLQELLDPVGGHAVFAIREGKEREVREILISMGYDTRFPNTNQVLPRTENGLLMQHPEAHPEFEPVFDLVITSDNDEPAIKSGKYSSELKKLETSEMLHVIDYAILMGKSITFDYAGSPAVRRGVYTMRPTLLQKTVDPVLEGVLEPLMKTRMFQVKKILKIGVNPG